MYVGVFIITFILTALITRFITPILAQKAKQPIYTNGPAWHVKKEGTPTMGGLSFLIAIFVVLILSSLFLVFDGYRLPALSLITCLGYSVLNSVVGIIDDATKLKRKKNAGLTPTEKLIFQFLISGLFLASRYFLLGERGTFAFSFGNIDLGFIYYPIVLLILVGITNCANLTDGIDGLATGVSFAIAISMFYISYAYSKEVPFIAAALIGATVGFLFFNLHPAKIFMGDTGSLFLGALCASCAVALGNAILIICLGAIYVIEGASVIAQVFYFKLTKKRLFKMAPLHHHLEKCGWSENKICISAIISTLLISALSYTLFRR